MRNTAWVQGAFATIVWVVCAVGIVGAIATLVLNRRTWEEYGKDQLLLDSEPPRPGATGSRPAEAISSAQRDEEVRQMLEARNARRRRRGEPEIDVDRELSRLVAPAVDDQLREEIRELVLARNHRRARRGEPALDVEAEVQRQIAELST